MDEHKQSYADIILSPEKVVELTKEKLQQIEEERLKTCPDLPKYCSLGLVVTS